MCCLFFFLETPALGKIISTFPSGTEILKSLELSDKLIGISDYCKYEKPIKRIGSALNPNLEQMAKLDPDWVILPHMVGNKKLLRFLKGFSINSIELKIDRLNDLYHSLEYLGSQFSKERKAKSIVEEIKKQLAIIKRKNAPQKILFVIGLSQGMGYIKNVTVASRQTFYGDVLEQMGLSVISPNRGRYPILGLEEFAQMNIDGIVMITTKKTSEDKNDWIKLNKKIKWIRFFEGQHYFIPGPKIVYHLMEIGRSL